ncbi:hypothetical protein D1007_29115 [Hordeum vulgare]|nr:hypothetical protein D1007_29115 [Hordeum vulgare]
MDNGDNLVVYARAMLPEEVAYLQAKRLMHQAHECARATPDFFQNTLVVHPARFFQRRPPTFKLRRRSAWRRSEPVPRHRRHQHYPSPLRHSPTSPPSSRTPRVFSFFINNVTRGLSSALVAGFFSV